MTGPAEPSTLDTNVAIYAFSRDPLKATPARQRLVDAAFASAQLLNEFANVVRKKQRVSWPEVTTKLEDILQTVPLIIPLGAEHSREAIRIADRYRLSFYDSLMLAVALDGGARTIYSEDMQHDLVIDGTLRIVDPFR